MVDLSWAWSNSFKRLLNQIASHAPKVAATHLALHEETVVEVSNDFLVHPLRYISMRILVCTLEKYSIRSL